MRNLKRALSLALASVMVMGLMVVGSSAAGYDDVTSEENVEAIEVLQAVGIMTGDENGNFNPTQNVTRNEMAVIMSNLMDYRVATYKGTSPFTDVPEWAEPYVAACYTNGIISGYSATTFGGSDPVVTSQGALMILKALGYFQNPADFGSDWQLATVSQANKIVLFDGVDSAVRVPMTRNDVAQLVLNGLCAGMVEADESNRVNVSIGDAQVSVGGTQYNYVTSGEKWANAIDNKLSVGNTTTDVSTRGTIVELGERLYLGDLKRTNWTKDSEQDAFGAPATRWSYKNEEIGTYADAPDYVFEGTVKSNAMYAAVGKTVTDRYNGYYYQDGEDDLRYYAVGDDPQEIFTLDDVAKNNKADLAGTGRGTFTYVYLDENRNASVNSFNGTAIFSVVTTWAGEVVKVKDGEITVADMDGKDLTFETEGYNEGDIILYTKTVTGNHEIQQVLGLAEMVEGKNATVRDQDRLIIDGTTYQYSFRFNDQNGNKLEVDGVDSNVSFYKDTQGNLIMFENQDISNDYAYVYSVGYSSSYTNHKDKEFGARLILTDGSMRRVTLDTSDTDLLWDENDSNDLALAKVERALRGQIISYSEEDGGAWGFKVQTSDNYKDPTELVESDMSTYEWDYDLADKYTWASANNATIVKSGTATVHLTKNKNVVTDKNTAFLIHEAGDDADDFTAYTGYNNVPGIKNTNDGGDTSKSTVAVAYVNPSTGVAKVVVITNAEVSGSAGDVIFVVGNPDAKINGTGTNRYYIYDAVVNGEVTTIRVKADDAADSAWSKVSQIGKKDIGVYFGMSQNSSGYVTKLTAKTPADVEVNGSTALDSGSGVYTAWEGLRRVTSGGNVSFNTANADTDGVKSFAISDDVLVVNYDNYDLEIGDRVSTDKNDKVWVIVDDGIVVAVAIKEVD